MMMSMRQQPLEHLLRYKAHSQYLSSWVKRYQEQPVRVLQKAMNDKKIVLRLSQYQIDSTNVVYQKGCDPFKAWSVPSPNGLCTSQCSSEYSLLSEHEYFGHGAVRVKSIPRRQKDGQWISSSVSVFSSPSVIFSDSWLLGYSCKSDWILKKSPEYGRFFWLTSGFL